MAPRRLARAAGPIAKPLAGTRIFRLWSILRHTGRTSGKTYATPIVALHTTDGFIIPLPFVALRAPSGFTSPLPCGESTQWTKNLVASGGGSIRFAGRDYEIADPRTLDTAEAAGSLPRWVRFMSDHVVGIHQFVLVRRVSD